MTLNDLIKPGAFPKRVNCDVAGTAGRGKYAKPVTCALGKGHKGGHRHPWGKFSTICVCGDVRPAAVHRSSLHPSFHLFSPKGA